ncbi:hypothetical protein BPOR_0006g00030 [Botrytis porri]|uniref:Uncharacterized protein n=1 Tax=Botrytis porri TaxID=87229 RepID=A0A4Z1L6Y6_9HELO|nr:hypothetical protein BPOR_0006g00030 [Botrytis porri]
MARTRNNAIVRQFATQNEAYIDALNDAKGAQNMINLLNQYVQPYSDSGELKSLGERRCGTDVDRSRAGDGEHGQHLVPAGIPSSICRKILGYTGSSSLIRDDASINAKRPRSSLMAWYFCADTKLRQPREMEKKATVLFKNTRGGNCKYGGWIS